MLTQKIPYSLLLCLFLFIPSLAMTSVPDLVTYKDAGNTFEVQFPVQPAGSSVDRKEYMAYSAVASDEDTEYKLVYSIHREPFSAADKTAFLNSAKEMFVTTQKGKVIKDKDVSAYGGISCKQVLFSKPGKKQVYHRIFFKGNVFYSLTVSALEKKVNKKRALEFFDSFKFSGATE